jgi:broad specificity phosphatase PhoE
MLELWLVRHGETVWNRERRIQGHSDVPLSDLGVAQAERLAARLAGRCFDAVYASDLQRAFQTAQVALPDQELRLDARLREINLGRFEGKVWADIPAEEQPLLLQWYRGPFDARVPEGESNDDLYARVQAWLADLPKAGRVIAFTHGGTIGSILYTVTGRPPEGTWSFRLENTSITKLLIGRDHTTVQTVNDAAHLEGMTLDHTR